MQQVINSPLMGSVITLSSVQVVSNSTTTAKAVKQIGDIT